MLQDQEAPGEGHQLISHPNEAMPETSRQLDRFMDRWIVIENNKLKGLGSNEIMTGSSEKMTGDMLQNSRSTGLRPWLRLQDHLHLFKQWIPT